jgi:predicted DNA-binding protein
MLEYDIQSVEHHMNSERTSLYLSVETKRQLEQAARRSGKSQTQLVNEALTEYLAKLEQPKFAFIGAGEDTVVTAQTSERWLRKHWKPSRKK